MGNARFISSTIALVQLAGLQSRQNIPASLCSQVQKQALSSKPQDSNQLRKRKLLLGPVYKTQYLIICAILFYIYIYLLFIIIIYRERGSMSHISYIMYNTSICVYIYICTRVSGILGSRGPGCRLRFSTSGAPEPQNQKPPWTLSCKGVPVPRKVQV